MDRCAQHKGKSTKNEIIKGISQEIFKKNHPKRIMKTELYGFAKPSITIIKSFSFHHRIASPKSHRHQ